MSLKSIKILYIFIVLSTCSVWGQVVVRDSVEVKETPAFDKGFIQHMIKHMKDKTNSPFLSKFVDDHKLSMMSPDTVIDLGFWNITIIGDSIGITGWSYPIFVINLPQGGSVQAKVIDKDYLVDEFTMWNVTPDDELIFYSYFTRWEECYSTNGVPCDPDSPYLDYCETYTDSNEELSPKQLYQHPPNTKLVFTADMSCYGFFCPEMHYVVMLKPQISCQNDTTYRVHYDFEDRRFGSPGYFGYIITEFTIYNQKSFDHFQVKMKPDTISPS